MTALVSLIFIAIIPIDCKLQIFPYNCLFTFLVTIIIFDELTSATSKERVLFSWVPHPLINEKVHIPVSFVFTLLALLHSAID